MTLLILWVKNPRPPSQGKVTSVILPRKPFGESLRRISGIGTSKAVARGDRRCRIERQSPVVKLAHGREDWGYPVGNQQ